MGHSALCFRISRRYSLIRRFLIVGQDVSCTQSRWTPTLVCYRFSAVTPIASLFTRTTLTPSLTGMISTRSPFASVDSMALISLSDSFTGFFILYFTTMHRIVKGYAFSRLSFTRFLYSSVCSVAARFKKCIGFIPLLVPNS